MNFSKTSFKPHGNFFQSTQNSGITLNKLNHLCLQKKVNEEHFSNLKFLINPYTLSFVNSVLAKESYRFTYMKMQQHPLAKKEEYAKDLAAMKQALSSFKIIETKKNR